LETDQSRSVAGLWIAVLSFGASSKAHGSAVKMTIEDDQRCLMIAALRYLDTFVKADGAWLFAERLLYVDWLEERALS
jgi:hypothetical protein